MLLTYVEIPGIYVDLDRDVLAVSDHVEVRLLEKGENQAVLKIKNSTHYDAVVTALVDHSMNEEQIGHLYYERLEKISVKAGEEIVKRIKG